MSRKPEADELERVAARRCLLLLGVISLLLVIGCDRESASSPPPAATGGEVDIEAPADESSTDWRGAPGTSDRRCVDVDRLLASGAGEFLGPKRIRILNVRSGEILAGNFASLDGEGKPGDRDFVAKIYYEPRRNGVAKSSELALSVVNLRDRPPSSEEQRFGGPHKWARSTEGYYFWSTGTRLPGHGRWRITAQAPNHWGCFIITT